jgi:nitrite reductase (NADH) small subunit
MLPFATSMAEFIEVAKTSDVPVGRAAACALAGRTIALYHTAQGFYASDNTCPHRGGPLSEGDLLGNEIVCPWHFWSFNVMTGENCADPSMTVPTFETKVEDDRVMVKQP